jgi:hypothetical protein
MPSIEEFECLGVMYKGGGYIRHTGPGHFEDEDEMGLDDGIDEDESDGELMSRSEHSLLFQPIPVFAEIFLEIRCGITL